MGNTDQMLFLPASLADFANQSPRLKTLFAAIQEMVDATRAALGEERLHWLRGLPASRVQGPMTLVHAGPEDIWRAPAHDASDAELASVYGMSGAPITVYAHIHRPYVRMIGGRIVANTGSVGLP